MTIFVAVPCCLVVPLVLGVIWFSPSFLGKPWMKYVFNGGEPSREAMLFVFLATNIGYTIAFALQYFILKTVIGVSTVEEALKISGCLIGVVLGTQVAHYAFGERPIGQYVIEQLFNVVILLCTALIIFYVG